MKNFDPNCIFCKIADGKINASKIYEDDEVISFLDTNPVTLGHALVIPKKHYVSFLTTPKSLMNHVMNVAQRIGQIDIEVLGASGVNILTNCNEVAGQVVKHFHVHVIPRYSSKDGIKIENKPLKDVNLPVVLEKFKEKI